MKVCEECQPRLSCAYHRWLMSFDYAMGVAAGVCFTRGFTWAIIGYFVLAWPSHAFVTKRIERYYAKRDAR